MGLMSSIGEANWGEGWDRRPCSIGRGLSFPVILVIVHLDIAVK